MSTRFGFGQEIKMDPLDNKDDTFNITFLDCQEIKNLNPELQILDNEKSEQLCDPN